MFVVQCDRGARMCCLVRLRCNQCDLGSMICCSVQMSCKGLLVMQ